MKVKMLVAAALLMGATPVFADQDEFCAGYEEGYKSVKGNMVIVPVCPIAPIAPINSTDFREGIKAGISKALES